MGEKIEAKINKMQKNPILTKFTQEEGTKRTHRAIKNYYKAAWNSYDLQKKFELLDARVKKTMKNMFKKLYGIPMEEARLIARKKGFEHTKSIIKQALKVLSFEGIINIFISFPFIMFTQYLPATMVVLPVLIAGTAAASLRLKALEIKYSKLKTIFKTIKNTIHTDWREWNLNDKTQNRWLRTVIMQELPTTKTKLQFDIGKPRRLRPPRKRGPGTLRPILLEKRIS